MHVHVKLEFVGLGKCFATELANARFFFGVRASHVTVVCRVRSECFSAVAAFERLLTAVLAYVSPQNGGCGKSLNTEGAFVRSLTTVHS